METQAPTRGKVLIMVAFALSCIGLLLYLWTAFGGPVPLKPKGYRFFVDFHEATNLSTQADVRISGVSVGKVVATSPTKTATHTEIELEPRYAPMTRDAQAILRIKTLLGETYVELTPGSPRAPKIPDGGQLAASQVKPTVELDEILRTFDRNTRRDFSRWLVSWSAALRHRGQDLNSVLGNAAPAAQDVDGVLAQLDSQRGAVSRLVHDSGVVFGAIGAREGAVRELIGSGDTVLRTTASHDRAITDTLRVLPTFLRELRPTLAVAERTATDAAPVVANLRGPAKRLRSTLASLSALAPDAKALFRDVDPLIALSRDALPALTKVVKGAGPLVDVLYPAGRQLVPIVQYLGLYKRELTTSWANIASSTQAVDRVPGQSKPQHYVRTLIPFTNEGFMQQAHRLPTNRHNAYFAPGALNKLAGGLDAYDCENTGNAPNIPVIGLGGPPPCRVQPPIEFRGLRSSFPHLTEDGP